MSIARLSLTTALLLGCAACRAPEPPPTDKPPEPQAAATSRDTALRDAIQAPLQKAQGVQQQVLDGAERTRKAEAGETAAPARDAAP